MNSVTIILQDKPEGGAKVLVFFDPPVPDTGEPYCSARWAIMMLEAIKTTDLEEAE